MDQNQPSTIFRPHPFEAAAEHLCFLRGLLECVTMLFQSTAVVANKLLVDDKITACVKQIMSPGLLYVRF